MLEAKNVSKKFSGVVALADINLALVPGKVTAIIGENGAGKSTLMKIFSGVHTTYEGDVLMGGKVVKFSGTKDAEAAGIAIIHQELNLVPFLSISENIFLGRELVDTFGILDRKKMDAVVADLLARLNLSVSPQTRIENLKVGQQQLVEIAKALYTNASVIIMDEPTSAISDKEVENLFDIISQLKSAGKTIAYISHKFNELFAVADYYVVLRDGVTVDQGLMHAATRDMLIHKMTGRVISLENRHKRQQDTAVALAVRKLSLKHPDQQHKYLLEQINFDLHKGEVLGVYGLMGAGRSEMLETIFGLHPESSIGEVSVNGVARNIKSPLDAIAAGIALVPEDRKLQGLILNQSVNKNIAITVLRQFEDWGFYLNQKRETLLSDVYVSKLGIKTSSLHNAAENLSGGNQQKIVIAKWLATSPAVLLLDEPTRGIDIKAKAEIYKLIRSLAEDGMAIVMVSSELPEILAASDRVLVLSEGRITADIPIEEATEQEILKLAIYKTNYIA